MKPGGEATTNIVEVHVRGTTLTAVLRGEIDAFTRDTVVSTVSAALPGVEVVELSLGSVTFMDSAGVGGMLALYRAVTNAGARLAMTDTTPSLQRLFSLSAITELFPLITSPGTDRGSPDPAEQGAIDAGGTPVGDGDVEGPNTL